MMAFTMLAVVGVAILTTVSSMAVPSDAYDQTQTDNFTPETSTIIAKQTEIRQQTFANPEVKGSQIKQMISKNMKMDTLDNGEKQHDLHIRYLKMENMKAISTNKKMANLRKKFVKKVFLKKDEFGTENIDPTMNRESESEFKPVVRSTIFEVGEPFYISRQKYVQDGIEIVPPFPEIYQESFRGSITPEILEKYDENYDAQPDKQWSENTEMPGTSTPTVAEVLIKRQRHVLPLIKKTEDTKYSPITHLNAKEERVFQPFSIRRYEEFETVPPFAELHIPSQHHNIAGTKKTDGPLVMPEKSHIHHQAGPELYPSSIFEKELRVPFF